MKTATHFLVLAILVGMVQGGAQPQPVPFRDTDSQAQVRAVLWLFRRRGEVCRHPWPLVFGGVLAVSGSSRSAILAIIAFFAVGG